jgi:hypothetical protein
MVPAYHPSNSKKHHIGGSWSRLACANLKTLFPLKKKKKKPTRKRKARGMPQAVECLSSKHEPLSLNPTAEKQKEGEGGGRGGRRRIWT